jgi:regulation of enolase protein 1 (concanavalin A-like superfamily)
MFGRIASVLLFSSLIPLLTSGIAAAQDYTGNPVQQRLCDVAYQNCRTQILDLINAEPASGSIDVAFWFMEDARYSNALVSAFQRGVRVRVLFDTDALVGSGSHIDTRKQIIAQLKGAGIPMRYKSSGGILHWKLMIFGAQNFVNFSAGNFSPDGYVPWTPYVNYEDEVTSFTKDVGLVSTFKSKYDDIWTTTTGYSDYANVTTLERYHATAPQDSRLNFPPTQNFATRLVKLIDQEQVKIDVDMYRITDAKPADAMIRAVQRGVTVRLYTEQLQYRDPTRLWHSYNVDRMWAAGVQVKDRAHEGLNHQKSSILYGQHTLVFGSSNWTTPSAASQLEHNIFTTEDFYFDFFVTQFNRKWDNTGPSPETKAFVPLPPDKPLYSAPVNGAAAQSTTGVTLSWNAGLWAHKYDIYLGTTSTLTSANLVAADLELGPSESPSSYRTFTTAALQPGTTYYWQVVSKTMANKTAAGPVWSFTTAGTPDPGQGQLPAGWSTSDIGAVGAPGNATFDSASNQFIVSGSGADIWGNADEFRYAFTTLTGDGSITARVNSITNQNAWTKAGVMMRDGVSAGAAHASMFVSSSRGLAFQRRPTPNGSSVNTAGPAATAPYWVRMSRSGNTFTAAVSTDGNNWTTVGTETIAMNSTIQVGLAVTSHADGAVSTAAIGSVTIGSSTPPPPPPPGTLPFGWSSSDIGAVAAAGSASSPAANQFVVSGSGADIWGTADEFRFAYTSMNGDGSIVARVSSITNEHAWTKAGVMMRDGTTPGAAHASMFVSAGKGLAFQWRGSASGTSNSTSGPFATAPYWVRMSRAGNTFTADVSTDGTNWTTVGSQTIAMNATIQVGLAVTSHLDGSVSTATFDSVAIGAAAPPPPPPPPPSLPSGWSTTDVGATSPAGSATFDSTSSTFAVSGAGADIWGTADAFRYAYTTLDGDGEIVARVDSVDNVDVWTKAGVMIRDGVGAGAAHATMLVSPTTLKGAAFQRRPVADGTSVSTSVPSVKPPYWVKLVRLGTAISAYASADGNAWTLVATETIPMATIVNAGLAVSSHRDGTLATATFSSVTVTKY